jgi:hypothetical protein
MNDMKKYLKIILLTLFVTGFEILNFFPARLVSAAATNYTNGYTPGTGVTETTNTGDTGLMSRLSSVAYSGGFNTGESALTLPQIIGTVIRVALSFLGAIFIALIIMAGYRWMTASGNEEDIKKAKGTIKQAVIGLCLTLFSYAIWVFIFQRLIS